MKKIISLCLAAIISTTTLMASAETFKHVDLPNDRTSLEYAGPINTIKNKINGFKWLGQTPEMMNGVVFEGYDNPFFGKDDTVNGEAIMVKATFYLYDKKIREELMIGRQSEIPGFVEFYGETASDLQLHIRMVDDDTFQAFGNAQDYRNSAKLMTYKKVGEFNKNKYKKQLKSARESGTLF
jgi:hypothetical protein